RIKILVKALGAEKYRELTEAEFAELKDGPMTLTEEEVARIQGCFTEPAYRDDVDSG
ncbi:MAG TPA: sulfite reductase, partial [Alcanivorax sp.]|nr:sulfite reductase [Alcanivorax sp.]